jgi:hypothetical protein
VDTLQAAERQKGQVGRVVLLYGRSTTPPAPVGPSGGGSSSSGLSCPMDLVYVHEKPSKENNTIQVGIWSGLDECKWNRVGLGAGTAVFPGGADGLVGQGWRQCSCRLRNRSPWPGHPALPLQTMYPAAPFSPSCYMQALYSGLEAMQLQKQPTRPP